ncbi:glycoside hydrolase family 65 protein [Ktedonobacter robiniae]|uniref:Kojibiose phosphorylase n=1 Tax=Ktedonobacter robiniae TaxID=2778365 RepID=A0ABQ3UR73_9CHLR|nr:glycoside hydrolase family 65 protein [Ktedonobacter robiniae]GHO55203.1 kojibiose phosphorylase [Ktedonobacter robiniae]
MNHWHINEDAFDPTLKKVLSQETVFTIGNGYFCTRGTFGEGYPRNNPATLLYGVFDHIPIAKEELANAPDWTLIQLFLNGERFRLDRGTILDYHRSLNLRQGLLKSNILWRSPAGIEVRVTSERFASLDDEHVGAIHYSATLEQTPQGQPCEVAIIATLNTAEGNYDVMHLETVDQGNTDDLQWLHCETKKTLVQIVMATTFQSETPNFSKELLNSDIAPAIRYSGTLEPGQTFSADKLVVIYTSRDATDDPRTAAIQHLQKLQYDIEFPYDQLLANNREAWSAFWNRADIIIEGDEKAQVGTRYNLYQLRINASSHDSRYSVAAKGMTGFGYRGHVFHDTEIFMLPFYTFVMPEVARNLLIYRYRLLDAARQKAASNGFQGAQFPWESTLSGEETTPSSIIHPETGEVIPVLNGFIEIHITASIAYATWRYWRVTGDDTFMEKFGAEILLSSALFWVSRVEEDPEKGDYVITDVIGPDEWHEHVNNNVFTNFMARQNIKYGLAVLEWLQQHHPEKAEQLAHQLELTEQDLAHWHEVSNKIRLPRDPQTSLFEQFDGFFNLEPLDQSKYHGRKDSYQGLLGVHAIQKYRIIKQADVLMLLTILTEEFDEQTKRVNWDYYYPITDHDYGSSLTPALHAILASELDETQAAYQLLMKGVLVDIENLRGNTPEGIHAACAGAVWQAIIFGFAGLRIKDDQIHINPHLPERWTRLAFTVQFRGQTTPFDIHSRSKRSR